MEKKDARQVFLLPPAVYEEGLAESQDQASPSCQAPRLSPLPPPHQVLHVPRELQLLEAFELPVEKLFLCKEWGHQPGTETACTGRRGHLCVSSAATTLPGRLISICTYECTWARRPSRATSVARPSVPKPTWTSTTIPTRVRPFRGELCKQPFP